MKHCKSMQIFQIYLRKTIMSTTQDVLNHHLESFGTYNLDALMEDYTEDSVIIFEDKVMSGLDVLRGFFSEFMNNMLPQGSEFNMNHMHVNGNVAYISWNGASDTLNFRLGTDTFVIENGKIATQTLAAYIEPK